MSVAELAAAGAGATAFGLASLRALSSCGVSALDHAHLVPDRHELLRVLREARRLEAQADVRRLVRAGSGEVELAVACIGARVQEELGRLSRAVAHALFRQLRRILADRAAS